MSKKPVFLDLIQDLVYYVYVKLTIIFDIDQDVIQIYNNENIKLFSTDLIDLTLKAGWNIRKSEKYNLVLEMLLSSPKNGFLFIIFSNFQLMIDINKIKLCKSLSLTNLI